MRCHNFCVAPFHSAAKICANASKHICFSVYMQPLRGWYILSKIKPAYFCYWRNNMIHLNLCGSVEILANNNNKIPSWYWTSGDVFRCLRSVFHNHWRLATKLLPLCLLVLQCPNQTDSHWLSNCFRLVPKLIYRNSLHIPNLWLDMASVGFCYIPAPKRGCHRDIRIPKV